MLFSHSPSFVLLAPTISGIKLGHRCGQSCFNTSTSTRFSFPRNVL